MKLTREQLKLTREQLDELESYANWRGHLNRKETLALIAMARRALELEERPNHCPSCGHDQRIGPDGEER